MDGLYQPILEKNFSRRKNKLIGYSATQIIIEQPLLVCYHNPHD